jgi:hypothetical protein
MREKILVPVRDVRLTLKTPNPWATKCFSKRYGGAEKEANFKNYRHGIGCLDARSLSLHHSSTRAHTNAPAEVH